MNIKPFLTITVLFTIFAFGLSAYAVESPLGNPYAQDWLEEYPEPVEIHIGAARINNVKYSPDGKFLAIVVVPHHHRTDGGLHLYNTQTLEKIYHIREFEVSYGWNFAFAFSPDSKTIANRNSDGNVSLWDTATGTHRQTIKTHLLSVFSVEFSPDGKTIASGGAEQTITNPDGTDENVRLWNASTGELLRSFLGHASLVTSVSFSPDGRTLASRSIDGIIYLWDTATGTHKRKITLKYQGIGDIAFSPNGETIASFGQWNGIQIWDANTGDFLHGLNREISDTDALFSIAFSPDGKTIASGSGAGVRLWDVDSGSYLRSFLIPPRSLNITSAVFSPDGKTIAGGSDHGTLYLWDIASSQLPEDVNADGVVNILDLVIVANAFGQVEPDLNDDGVVSILDLTLVASAFGNTVASSVD